MTAYVVNGEKATREEFLSHLRQRKAVHGGVAGIVESGVAPGGHAPYWGQGHNSFGLGCPPFQRAEYDAFLKKEGCTGYRLEDDGSVTTASPGNKQQILDARGLAERTPYGTGKKTSDIPIDPPKSSAPDAEKIKAAAARIRQSPKIRHMLGE